MIKIKSKNSYIRVQFDYGGHIYLSTNLNKLYELVIDNKNGLYCDEISDNYEKSTIEYTTGKIKLFDDSTTLKGALIKQKKIQIDNSDEDNSDEDSNNSNKISSLYYEDNEYNDYNDYNDYEINSDDSIISFNADDKQFKISDIDKLLINGYDTAALYETLIYNNQLMFKTKILNDNAMYRLCICAQTGEISFRAIGDKEKKYILSAADNDNIILTINNN